jgi:hypothetical protein
MRKELLIIALGLTVAAGRAPADVLSVSEPETRSATKLPAKGTSMTDVEKKFGEPRAKQPPVGGETPKHPPITRWDYDGFVVVFERDKVIDAVVPGAPPQVFHKDELQPAPGMAPPPMPPPMSEAPAAPAPAEPAEPAAMAPEPGGLAPDETQPAPEPPHLATPENPNPDRPPPPAQ